MTATPGLPSPIVQTTSEIAEQIAPALYQLFHRQGSNPHTLIKYFHLRGDLRQAIARGQKHCELMNYRFISVRHFISDFSAEERVATQ